MPVLTSSLDTADETYQRYARRDRDRGRLLAAWGTEFTVSASIITGVGVIEDTECVIIAGRQPRRAGGV